MEKRRWKIEEKAAEELTNALGAFKMQLDTRDQLATRKTKAPTGIRVRESSFGSQLPEPKVAPQIPLQFQNPCMGYGMGTITVTFSGIQKNTPPGDPPAGPSALNGVWTLPFIRTDIVDGGQICIWQLAPGGDVFGITAVMFSANPLEAQWQLEGGAANSSFMAVMPFGAPTGNSGPNGGTGTISF
jgi:hypothetical protein